MADFSRELWFASERSDEKQNIRMHQIRMRTFGCDLRTFGYEQRTMVSHPNSEIRSKWRWALKSFAAVNSNKETISEFQSTFVQPQKQISKRSELGLLKVKGAEFIVSILDDTKQCKGQALKLPRPKGKPKSMTYWKPPSIYGGDSIMSSQVFPFWFQFLGKEPQPTRLVYFQKTTRSQLNKELELRHQR